MQMMKTLTHTAGGWRRAGLFSGLLVVLLTMMACNESVDDGPKPEPSVVTSLYITVTGATVQAPYGNVYLFYSEETNLNYAVGRETDRSLMPDGNKAPLIDVSRPFNPVVRYEQGGRSAELHPVSPYGSSSDGSLYGFWHLESIDSIEGGTADQVTAFVLDYNINETGRFSSGTSGANRLARL